MAQDFGTPITPVDQPKKSNTTLIIVIVIVVLLCCCCAIVAGAAYWAWNNGDQWFGISQQIINLLV